MFYKFDFGVLKFKSPFLKSNVNLLNQMMFSELFNIHSINFLDQHDIKVALHKYVRKF
jgi:hypothetical protein